MHTDGGDHPDARGGTFDALRLVVAAPLHPAHGAALPRAAVLHEHAGPVVCVLRAPAAARGAYYVGATVDLRRRIEQHNRSLAGGARRTHRHAGAWRRALHVEGFRTFREALQFEWALRRAMRRNGRCERAAAACVVARARWRDGPSALHVVGACDRIQSS